MLSKRDGKAERALTSDEWTAAAVGPMGPTATDPAISSPAANAEAERDERQVADWRARELCRVDAAHLTYLDYTGAALYPESLVRADAERLASAVLGNPHSEHGPSRASTSDIDSARRSLLRFVNADPDEYTVVLTANASAACRLVGESFPFEERSTLLLTADNHNSVNGIREFARSRGARSGRVALDDQLRLHDAQHALEQAPGGPSLFAFPAQSNFSGVRHDLALIDRARSRGWRVLLDAASFLPTAELDLRVHRPDFVVLSLYKIIGYPTGIGALVARREALGELRRPWFAGGTVRWVSVESDRHRLGAGAESFEDGTLPFLLAGAVEPALDQATAVDRSLLARHLQRLTRVALCELGALVHANGAPAVLVYGPADARDRGATIALSLLDPAGVPVPYWAVEDAARDAGIAIRGGCFCNPGCAERAFGFPAEVTDECLDELGDSFSVPRLAACLGDRAVGAIRVSMGLGSVEEDVLRFVRFVRSHLGAGEVGWAA